MKRLLRFAASFIEGTSLSMVSMPGYSMMTRSGCLQVGGCWTTVPSSRLRQSHAKAELQGVDLTVELLKSPPVLSLHLRKGTPKLIHGKIAATGLHHSTIDARCGKPRITLQQVFLHFKNHCPKIAVHLPVFAQRRSRRPCWPPQPPSHSSAVRHSRLSALQVDSPAAPF